MIHLSIVPHGEAAAVVIPGDVLDAAGLRIGDILEVTLQDRQLILQSNADAAPSTDREITQEVLECRREAYQRQIDDNAVHEKPERILQKLPVAMQRVQDQERFDRLAEAWKKDTFLLSKISVKVMHSAYQKIIGMGPAAVPFLLKDLAEKRSRLVTLVERETMGERQENFRSLWSFTRSFKSIIIGVCHRMLDAKARFLDVVRTSLSLFCAMQVVDNK